MDTLNQSPLNDAQRAALARAGTPFDPNPSWMLTCDITRAGEYKPSRVAMLQASGQSGSYIALAEHPPSPDGYESAALRDEHEAASYLVQALAIEPRHGGDDAVTFAIGVDGYAALLAAADVVQAARLRSQLARLQPSKPVLNAELLQREWDRSASQSDARWAGVAGVRTCLVPIPRGSGEITRGLTALRDAGLVHPIQRGHVPTEGADRVLGVLSQLTLTAGLTSSAPRDGARTVLRHAAVFVSARGACLGHWSGTDDRATVRIVWLAAGNTLDAMRTLLQTTPDPAASAGAECGHCGRTLRNPQVRFCTHCGTRVPAGIAP